MSQGYLRSYVYQLKRSLLNRIPITMHDSPTSISRYPGHFLLLVNEDILYKTLRSKLSALSIYFPSNIMTRMPWISFITGTTCQKWAWLLDNGWQFVDRIMTGIHFSLWVKYGFGLETKSIIRDLLFRRSSCLPCQTVVMDGRGGQELSVPPKKGKGLKEWSEKRKLWKSKTGLKRATGLSVHALDG